MLRCPFNNFSKCDGSCPFSMPDFAGCKLATSLVAIGGQTQGIHARLTTINEQLAKVMEMIENMGDAGTSEPAGIGGPVRFSGTYLTCKARSSNNSQQPEVRLSLSDDDAAAVLAALGDTVNYVFNDSDGSILLMRGAMRKLSKAPNKGERRSLSLQSDGMRIVNTLGEFKHVGYDVAEFDGIFKLTPNGRRD